MSDERPTNPFPPSIREKFFDIITAEGYKCKERVHPEKIRQYILFLDDPNKKPERGNQAESKLRYDAFKFYELKDNKLYRKPEGKILNLAWLYTRMKLSILLQGSIFILDTLGETLSF